MGAVGGASTAEQRRNTVRSGAPGDCALGHLASSAHEIEPGGKLQPDPAASNKSEFRYQEAYGDGRFRRSLQFRRPSATAQRCLRIPVCGSVFQHSLSRLPLWNQASALPNKPWTRCDCRVAQKLQQDMGSLSILIPVCKQGLSLAEYLECCSDTVGQEWRYSRTPG
jgi:hypothetical protein